MANEFRAPRVWHIEERFGYAYATNQYGGFTQYSTCEEASAAIDADIAKYGDTRTDQPDTSEDDEHRLENHGKIYFSLAAGEAAWRLDPAAVDGYALDGLDEIECTYGNRHVCPTCRTDEGSGELARAEQVPLPTGRDVLDMLAENYGYTLVPRRAGGTSPGGDPDQMLARFRTALAEIETLAADYHANPDNEADASATATYVDRHTELLAGAVDAADGLDAAATGGMWPQQWARANAA